MSVSRPDGYISEPCDSNREPMEAVAGNLTEQRLAQPVNKFSLCKTNLTSVSVSREIAGDGLVWESNLQPPADQERLLTTRLSNLDCKLIVMCAYVVEKKWHSIPNLFSL